ncbi:MAG: hypothetical protein P8X81_14250, partial [Woeseiaceae bacterium]
MLQLRQGTGEMLKPQYPTILGLMLLIGVLPTYSQAQDAPTDYEDLKAQLAERNAVIIELQRSVADLQDQLAVLESQLQNKSTGKDEIPPLRRDDSPRQTSRRSDTGRLIVDEVAAERALERTLVQAGVLLLPRGALELTPSLSMAVSDFELATIVDVGAGDELGIVRVDRSSYSLALTGRIGLPFDSQLEFSIPYLSVTEDSALSVLSGSTDAISQTGRGTGDFVVGVSKTLWRESAHTPDVVGRIVWNAGNGSEDDDGVVLGGGFSSLTGSLSFMKRLDPLALILSLDYE